MTTQAKDDAPKQAFPEIVEILEHMFSYLDYLDIVAAMGVCRLWAACVRGSQLLLGKTHKVAITIRPGDNPHFTELTEASKEAVLPRHKYKNQNLWALVRKYEDGQLDHMHEVPAEYEETEEHNKEVIKANQGVRISNGWPVGLRELHCDLCDKWHTDFRFENLHPLFGFLEDMTMCFRGQGAQLIMCLSTVADQTAPKECWMHSADEARKFATQLRKVYKAVETGSVAKDYFSQPAVTKLGSSGAWTIENKGGLQLEKVVPFIFEMFHGHLYYWRNRCHKIEKRPVSRDWRTERDTAATYPTTDDWDRHMANFSEITRLWEGTIAEVDLMMADVPIWASALAEDAKAPEYYSITV